MPVAIFHKALFQEHHCFYYDGLAGKWAGRSCFPNVELLLLAKFSISKVAKQVRREKKTQSYQKYRSICLYLKEEIKPMMDLRIKNQNSDFKLSYGWEMLGCGKIITPLE